MNADQIRSIQAPLKEKYRDDPASAIITLKATGKTGEGLTCKVDTGKSLAEAGLHPATGGNGMAACSGDMLLEALVACAGVTLKTVATAINLQLNNATVAAEGDLDFRGTLGVSKEAPVGFKQIRLHYDLETPATDDEIATLLKLTERYCVVYQTLRSASEIKITHSH
ncbi:MAG: OsmC family protein [Balneolaceae bacterium]